jgi:hypothetical protein
VEPREAISQREGIHRLGLRKPLKSGKEAGWIVRSVNRYRGTDGVKVGSGFPGPPLGDILAGAGE